MNDPYNNNPGTALVSPVSIPGFAMTPSAPSQVNINSRAHRKLDYHADLTAKADRHIAIIANNGIMHTTGLSIAADQAAAYSPPCESAVRGIVDAYAGTVRSTIENWRW